MKTTNGTSTFNLRRYLAIRHNSGNINSSVDQKATKPLKIRSFVKKEHRDEIDRLFLNCIIYGDLAYNHFSNPLYDELFEKLQPGYRTSDKRTFAKRIKKRYREYTSELTELLPKDRPIAFTTNIWKNSKRKYYNMFDCSPIQ